MTGQTVQPQVIGWLLNHKLQGMWKEAETGLGLTWGTVSNFLKGLRETAKYLRIIDVPVYIRTGRLPNMNAVMAKQFN